MNMNFQDQIQQIFGTTDIYELKQISKDADNYRYCQAVPCFPSDDLQSDKASL